MIGPIENILECLLKNVSRLRLGIDELKRNQPNDPSLPQLQRLLEKVVQTEYEARDIYEKLKHTDVF